MKFLSLCYVYETVNSETEKNQKLEKVNLKYFKNETIRLKEFAFYKVCAQFIHSHLICALEVKKEN